MLAVLDHKGAGGKVRVVTVLAVAVVDGDVVSEGAAAMVLVQAEVVRVNGSSLHRYDAASGPWRDIVGMQRVAPVRERTVGTLCQNPWLAGWHRQFITVGDDDEGHGAA